MFAEQPYWYC